MLMRKGGGDTAVDSKHVDIRDDEAVRGSDMPRHDSLGKKPSML